MNVIIYHNNGALAFQNLKVHLFIVATPAPKWVEPITTSCVALTNTEIMTLPSP